MNRLRNFLVSLRDPSSRRRMLPFLIVGGLVLIILLALPPAWEYSNSPSFCGETCHTMPPEFNTYLVSPHARVLCVDCHIGRGLLIQQFIRKTGHLRLLADTITNNYEYPIFVSTMRPARETCELCHFPEKFSDDSLRVMHRFAEDEENTPYDVYLLMHTGGGSHREGLGLGIHWHVENVIEFVATDELQQDIPWIRVNNVDGTTDVYLAEGATIDTGNLEQYTIAEMDCMTCHNRISHLIDTPGNTVNAALYRGDLSPDMPFIRARAGELLAEKYESTAEAEEAFAALENYYVEEYPAFADENEDAISRAISTLEQIYADNNYPEQELTWETHPNNVGHRDWPGCFRCHDGRHFNAEGEAVRLECNLCHSIPLVAQAGEIEPVLPLTTGFEPSSHLDSTWISRHHNEFDETCGNCHTLENPGGTSSTSFCSNSACHGVDWRYGGFDAPTLAIELGIEQALPEAPAFEAGEGPLTYQTFLPLFAAECGACHGENPERGLRVTDYASLMAGSRGGPVIVPGDPDASFIFEVLADDHFGHFTDDQLALLRQWIAEGAIESAGEAGAEGAGGATGEEAAAGGGLTYQTFQPIFEARCGECHGQDDPARGLRLTDFAGLMAGSTYGPVVVPGSPQDSYILEAMQEEHAASLTTEQYLLLRQWIAAGAPER